MTTAPTFERDFYRELLVENPALLARIVAFNRGGAASASPCVRFAEELSKDEPTDVDWADLIARHPDLCALAAERTAPEEKAGDDYWGFAETSERFALIPEDELDRLVRRAAAAVYGAEIAVTVRKDEHLVAVLLWADWPEGLRDKTALRFTPHREAVGDPPDDAQLGRRVRAFLLKLIKSEGDEACRNLFK